MCGVALSFENSALVLSEDCLDKYDEEETEDLKEIDGYYWSFNPHEIENYGITITEIENGFLIQYDVPVYRDDYGDNILDYSDAMEGSMKNLSKKYPDVKYYGYEGYYSSDTSDGACSQSEFYSSPKEIPDINSFIGNYLTSLNWNVVINSFGEYEDMNEEKENELIVFAMKYKEFIGNYTISILKEALEEYRSIQMVVSSMDDEANNIKEFIFEIRRILVTKNRGVEVNLTKLRRICQNFDEVNTDGTDEELLQSAEEYRNKMFTKFITDDIVFD